MKRLTWPLAIAAAAAIGLSGCAASGAVPPASMSMGASADAAQNGPTDAAKMICGAEVADNIMTILALTDHPHTVDSWTGDLYTCTYHLSVGPLVLSVKQSASDAAALDYFHALAAKLAPTTTIDGLANLGLPGYTAATGSVVFAKDNMTLQVDASELPATVGPHQISRSDFAYQVATGILACWKE